MSGRADAVQIGRWQREVARDAGSAAFLPLAEVYRREGRLDVARRLCIRGLERHPEHVEAHVLLGRIYRESGDQEKAFDEWDIALRLDGAHRAARRAIAYLCLERRDWARAAHHLEVAGRAEPGDARLRSALALALRHAAVPAGMEAPVKDPAAALERPVADFARAAQVRTVVVLETSGRILLRHGMARGLDLAAFASLAAGVHVASRAIARMLGQPSFEQLYQGAGEHQLLLGPLMGPDGELILVAVFGEETNVGLVRVCFDALAREVAALDWMGDPRALETKLAAGLHDAAGDPRSPAIRP